MNWKYIVYLVLVVLLTILIVQNSAPVEVKFLFTSFSISLALIFIISVIIGILTAIFASFVKGKGKGSKVGRKVY